MDPQLQRNARAAKWRRWSRIAAQGMRGNPDLILVPLCLAVAVASLTAFGSLTGSYVQNVVSTTAQSFGERARWRTRPGELGLGHILSAAITGKTADVVDEIYDGFDVGYRKISDTQETIRELWTSFKLWLAALLGVEVVRSPVDDARVWAEGTLRWAWGKACLWLAEGGLARALAWIVGSLATTPFWYVSKRLLQKYTKSEAYARTVKWLVASCTPSAQAEGVGTRSQFNRLFRYVPARESPGHNHAKGAAQRNGASTSIQNFITAIGMRPYVISSSARDVGLEGMHGAYMDKDFCHPRKMDPVDDDHIIMAVDCDYYLHMPSWLAMGRPIILYTQVPRKVAGADVNAMYTIVDGELICRANSDAAESYRHKLWDYSNDYVLVSGWFGAWVVSIQRKAIDLEDEDNSREVICLTPEQWIPAPFSWIWKYGPEFRRRSFDVGSGVNCCGYSKPNPETGALEAWMSIGIAGQYDCIDLPSESFYGILGKYRRCGKPEISTVERALGLLKHIRRVEAKAPTLFETMERLVAARAETATEASEELVSQAYLPGGGPGGAYYSIPDSARTDERRAEHYQARGDAADGFLFHEEGRIIARAVGPPLLTNPAVTPMRGHNNELASVTGRVLRVGNEIVPTDSRVNGWVTEFSDFIHDGQSGYVVPYTLEDVKKRQTGRAQRDRASRNMFWDSPGEAEHTSGSCFVKAEAYAQPNDPRNITTTGTTHMQEMSCYTYAVKDSVLKRQKWYSPGMSPAQVASRVMDLAANAPALQGTDYRRFDGTISSWLSGAVSGIYERAFRKEHRDHVRRMWASEVNATCRTKTGVKFRAAGGRMSGSPQTTDGNTIINAFASYVALRHEGYTAVQAWDLLGLYCGDDGLSQASPSALEWMAKQLGLSITVDVYEKYSPVAYLGRIFVDPWTTNQSVQDPLRTIAKIHLTTADHSIPLAVAAVWRAKGYLSLDPEAPLVAAYCRYLLRIHGQEAAEWEVEQATRTENRLAMLKELREAETPYWVRPEQAGESWPSIEEHGPGGRIAWAYLQHQCGVELGHLMRLEQEIEGADERTQRFEHAIDNERTSKLYAEISGGAGGSRLIGKEKYQSGIPEQPSRERIMEGFEIGREDVGVGGSAPLCSEDHSELVADDKVQRHRHVCTKCHTAFTHSHIIVADPEARAARQAKYQTWCRDCKKRS